MIYPVYICVVIGDDKKQHIVRTIMDLHPSLYKRAVDSSDGCVNIIDYDNMCYKLGITFDDLHKLWKELYSIEDRFAPIVDSYAKDSISGILNNEIKKDGEEPA